MISSDMSQIYTQKKMWEEIKDECGKIEQTWGFTIIHLYTRAGDGDRNR
jgi:hypothetical protein